jgi:hypothetical protein
MNELGGPLPEERLLIYHGVAFADLSRLVYPGSDKVRFACRVHPYSKELLHTRTCLTKSAVSEILPEMIEVNIVFLMRK